MRPVLIDALGAKGNLAALARLADLPLPLPIAGLSAKRSLLDIRSLADSIRLLLQAEEPATGPFVRCDREPASVAEVVAAIRRGEGRKPRLFAIPDALLAASLRLAGRGAAWQRLVGPLVTRSEGLESLGWKPTDDTADRIARYFAGDRGD